MQQVKKFNQINNNVKSYFVGVGAALVLGTEYPFSLDADSEQVHIHVKLTTKYIK